MKGHDQQEIRDEKEARDDQRQDKVKFVQHKQLCEANNLLTRYRRRRRCGCSSKTAKPPGSYITKGVKGGRGLSPGSDKRSNDT